ncbi:hypothetical protein C8Q74DRAFT_1271803 [Fomes fomentarius]|nr:hypothetical protein C8Q74DRAFT_1271803 [Fomes fomentarius]
MTRAAPAVLIRPKTRLEPAFAFHSSPIFAPSSRSTSTVTILVHSTCTGPPNPAHTEAIHCSPPSR